MARIDHDFRDPSPEQACRLGEDGWDDGSDGGGWDARPVPTLFWPGWAAGLVTYGAFHLVYLIGSTFLARMP